jgi:hypothetical protein
LKIGRRLGDLDGADSGVSEGPEMRGDLRGPFGSCLYLDAPNDLFACREQKPPGDKSGMSEFAVFSGRGGKAEDTVRQQHLEPVRALLGLEVRSRHQR